MTRGTTEVEAERLSVAELEACRDAFDACVEREPDIDRFCSRTEWILPYHRAFLPGRELYLYRGGPGGRSFVALASGWHERVGRYLESIENMWCFASPLVGPDCAALLQRAIADCGAARDEQDPNLATDRPVPVLLSGIADLRTRQSLLGRVALSLADRYDVHAVDETRRFVASLEGGFEGWLSRRSRSFRKSLRTAQRRAEPEGLVFESLEVSSAEAARDLYPRILALEARSWKSASGSGADTGSLRAFYADMLPRLAERRALRVVVVRRDGEDLGYLHGAVVGDHFRGLQMSYDERWRHLSLGNLLQRETILRLCEEGIATYDLGTRSDYKRRWAEEGLRTLTVLARPR